MHETTMYMKSSGLDIMETVMKAVAGFLSKALFSVPISTVLLGRRNLAGKLGQLLKTSSVMKKPSLDLKAW